MRRSLSFLLGIVSLLTCAVSAQDATALKPELLSTVTKSTEIISLTVKNKQGETLGKVDNIVLDPTSGCAAAVKQVKPTDQGSSKADTSITTQIRRDVTALNNLSADAQNVKIITLKGRVTLRGPVNTADEKSHIGSIASRIARSKNVDNQLEVKSATASN